MWSLVMIGDEVRVRGVAVSDVSQAGESEANIGKVAEALRLLEDYAPEDFALVVKCLKRVIVYTGSGVEYSRTGRACFIDAGFLDRLSVERVAMLLVHEATHGAIMDEGASNDSSNQSVDERRCADAEIRVARAIPGADYLVREVLDGLERPWWGEEQLHIRRMRHLRAAGFPKWMLAWFERLNNRRAQ